MRDSEPTPPRHECYSRRVLMRRRWRRHETAYTVYGIARAFVMPFISVVSPSLVCLVDVALVSDLASSPYNILTLG